MSGSTIVPVPVGKVGRLFGVRFRADVAFDDPDRFQTGYEVQLAERSAPDAPAWDAPLWRYSTRPVADGGGGAATPGKPPDRPFVTLDNCPAEDEMQVTDTRPRVLLRFRQPISEYEWQLLDDLAVIDEGANVTSGISADGLWIGFRPTKRLRRSGRARHVNLGPGVFKPPFEPPRERGSKARLYTGITYAGHSAQSVDFNRGTGEQDRGDPVYAAAKGVVKQVVENNGEVHIDHAGGWETVYAHMRPVEVKEGDPVKVLTRIGRVGDRYFKNPVETISPHLHHQQLLNGVPTRMKFDGKPYVLGRAVPGWRRPIGKSEATLRIRARRVSDGTWSRQRELTFHVRAGEGEGKTCSDIDVAYDGPEVPRGDYSLRYRVRDSDGDASPWAYDHSIERRAQ